MAIAGHRLGQESDRPQLPRRRAGLPVRSRAALSDPGIEPLERDGVVAIQGEKLEALGRRLAGRPERDSHFAKAGRTPADLARTSRPGSTTASAFASTSNQLLTINMHEAKSRLSELVRKAEEGEVVVLTRGGKPAVRLVPVAASPSRSLGVWRDAVRRQPAGWDEKIPAEDVFPELLAPEHSA